MATSSPSVIYKILRDAPYPCAPACQPVTGWNDRKAPWLFAVYVLNLELSELSFHHHLCVYP